MRSILSGSLATLAIASIVSAQENIADLVAKLRLAPTEVDRINILEDKDVSILLQLRYFEGTDRISSSSLTSSPQPRVW